MFTAVLLAGLTAGAPPEDEAAKAAVAVELAKLQMQRTPVKAAPIRTTTTCNCAVTGNCLCWESKCVCPACRVPPRVEVPAFPFPPVSTTPAGRTDAETVAAPSRSLPAAVLYRVRTGTTARAGTGFGTSGCLTG